MTIRTQEYANVGYHNRLTHDRTLVNSVGRRFFSFSVDDSGDICVLHNVFNS